MTQPLTDAITALTRYANEVTGQSDTNLSDAVRTLCDGYGGGGATDYFAMKMTNAECDEYRNDEITTIESNHCISRWTNLKKLTLPNVTHISIAQALGGNGNVNLEVNLKGLRTCVNQGLQSLACKNIVLPNWQGDLNTYVLFQGNIPIVDIGEGLGTIKSNSLTSCRDTLILRKKSAICPLQNTNALYSATWGASGTGGTLYVPQDLISSYQSASNWSTILGYANNQILPIEGSIYETQYADGTPIE